MEPQNTEEARAAYMRHVFGDMMKLEARLAATGQLIYSSISILRETKTDLSTETEQLLLKALADIEKSANSLSGSERRIADVASDSARAILLGEFGPVTHLNKLVDRIFMREVEATKWLKKAVAQTERRWIISFLVAAVGGAIAGVIVKYI